MAILILGTVYLPLISANALIPNACNCVIFRMDDVQDYWLNSVQTAVMDKFITKNANLTLGIVMNFVGNDPVVVDKVRQGHSTNLFELVDHGWNHVDYSTLTLQQQMTTLQDSSVKMQSLWGRGTKVFIPPYNAYDNNTLQALKNIGWNMISSEFDLEIVPTSQIYKAVSGSSIVDNFGIYHLPQEVGYYNYNFDPPRKNTLRFIESNIDTTINNYGYVVVTLHPQDFTVKDSNNQPTSQLSSSEMSDLNTLIDWVRITKSYKIQNFSQVAKLALPPIIDNTPPVLVPPADKAIISSQTITPVNLGAPSVTDNVDPSPIITNNAPPGGFPQGTTFVTWNATDHSGNSASAIQYVTVRTSADSVKPLITNVTPANNAVINGPAAGVNVIVTGTASDSQSGLKYTEVRTSTSAYKVTTPGAPFNWNSWSTVVNIKSSGSNSIIGRATDYWGNQQWYTTPITVNLSGPDTTPPVVTPPPNVIAEATGIMTPVQIGKASLFDNSDPIPKLTNDAPGASESTGYPLGVTSVHWTGTDISGNSASATQTITIQDTIPPGIPTPLAPTDGAIANDKRPQLFWSDETDLVSTTTYDLLVASDPNFSGIVIQQSGLTASTFAVPTDLNDGTYYWKVRSSDAMGNKSPYSAIFHFAIDTTAPTVSASPAAGTYNSPQSVTLTASEPATIYYTTDGSAPTQSSTVYTSPITISSAATVRFFAIDSVGYSSTLESSTYTIDTVIPTVIASPAAGTYNSPQSVTLTASKPGATIYYTTDGSTPTTSSITYSGPIGIASDTTLKFFAKDTAGNVGTVVTQTYLFDSSPPTASATPSGGLYATSQSIALTASEPATIYYTTDGSAPTQSSTVYTGPINISTNTDLKFFAKDTAGNVGTVVTESYTIDNAAPTVSASPTGGIYDAPQSVTLTASEPATIYYTTDGSAPTQSSTIYNSPILVPVNTALKFFAKDTAGNVGTVVTELYESNSQAPTVSSSPPGGLYNTAQSVTLTASKPDSTIYYTTDGSAPTQSSTVYTAAISIPTTTTLKYFAKDNTGNVGIATTELYTIDTAAPSVSASPIAGFYDAPQSVTLTASEPATIYYTTDGSTPTTSSTVYTTSINISSNTDLKFFAKDTAGNVGTVVTASYTFDTTPSTVIASPAGGTYNSPQSVTLTASKPDSTIYYTTDGSTPTTSSTVYTTSINISSNTDLKFFARNSLGIDSPVKTESYIFDTTAPTVSASPAAGTYNSPQSVTLTASEPATIYYTTDGSAPTQSSTVYTGPIGISSDVTLKFFAKDTAGNVGTVVTQAYAFDTSPPTVSASPSAGTYNSPQSVTLTASEPATIYYTTDGSTPTTSSTVYTTSINISSNTDLKFFAKDTAGNVGTVVTQTYTINIVTYPVTQMSDTTATFGLAMYGPSSSTATVAHVEFVSASSQLVGKSIDQITLKLRKTGSPTGTAEIGIFNADLTAKTTFATRDVSTISSTYTDYTFSLSNNALYTLQAGDRIGIKYTGGSSTNFVAVMMDKDSTDPFDGSNTYRQQFNSSWLSYLPDDMYMILKQTHG